MNPRVNRKTTMAIAAVAVAASIVLVFTLANANSGGKGLIGSKNYISSSSFPQVVNTDVRTNPWKGFQVKNGKSAGPGQTNNGEVINGNYSGISATQGTVILNNQTFFMTTLDGNLKSILFDKPDGTAVTFANVTFIFARPPNIPLPTNPVIPIVVQFQDGTIETLAVQVQQDRPMTVLSSHTNPRAGIMVTQGGHLMTDLTGNQGKVKLLVSTGQNRDLT